MVILLTECSFQTHQREDTANQKQETQGHTLGLCINLEPYFSFFFFFGNAF